MSSFFIRLICVKKSYYHWQHTGIKISRDRYGVVLCAEFRVLFKFLPEFIMNNMKIRNDNSTFFFVNQWTRNKAQFFFLHYRTIIKIIIRFCRNVCSRWFFLTGGESPDVHLRKKKIVINSTFRTVLYFRVISKEHKNSIQFFRTILITIGIH